jgi:hypothetical protein
MIDCLSYFSVLIYPSQCRFAAERVWISQFAERSGGCAAIVFFRRHFRPCVHRGSRGTVVECVRSCVSVRTLALSIAAAAVERAPQEVEVSLMRLH